LKTNSAQFPDLVASQSCLQDASLGWRRSARFLELNCDIVGRRWETRATKFDYPAANRSVRASAYPGQIV